MDIAQPRALGVALGLVVLLAIPGAQTHSAPTLPVAAQGSLSVLATVSGEPDDVVIARDGTIYFGDLTSNRVLAIAPDGSLITLSAVIKAPEGLAMLDDGSFIVVEQASNKLYRIDPVTQARTLYYTVGNSTKNPGIDGITRDPVSGDLIIPDAPTGRILRLSADGKHLTLIANRFYRPTSVALSPDGTLYVCDEYGHAIYRLAPDGRITLVTRITLPDDIIFDASGMLLVNSLRGTVWRIDPATGKSEPFVTGLVEPHGIALEKDGSVIITDAKLKQVFRLTYNAATPMR